MGCRPQDKTCKLCFAKEGDLISLLGPDGEPCSDVWEVCARDEVGRKPAPEGASNGLYSDERDFFLRRELKGMWVHGSMPHLSTRVAIIRRKKEMKKLVKLGDLKVGDEFELNGKSCIVRCVGTLSAIVCNKAHPCNGFSVDNAIKVTVPVTGSDCEQNLSLLRPVDYKALSFGDKVLHFQGECEVTYIAGPDTFGNIVVEDKDKRLRLRYAKWYRMKPLFWLEGWPVYEGDKLFSPKGVEVQVLRIGIKTPSDPLGLSDVVEIQLVADGRTAVLDQYKLHWTKPKVKKEAWINVYGLKLIPPRQYDTKDQADASAGKDRVACVRVEWEE